MNNLFRIDYGPQGGDATGPYYITLLKECTVREFINEWLKNKGEWGYFGIHDKAGHLCRDYKYGEIVGDPLPDYILDSTIKRVNGSGGWSRSDFIFWI